MDGKCFQAGRRQYFSTLPLHQNSDRGGDNTCHGGSTPPPKRDRSGVKMILKFFIVCAVALSTEVAGNYSRSHGLIQSHPLTEKPFGLQDFIGEAPTTPANWTVHIQSIEARNITIEGTYLGQPVKISQPEWMAYPRPLALIVAANVAGLCIVAYYQLNEKDHNQRLLLTPAFVAAPVSGNACGASLSASMLYVLPRILLASLVLSDVVHGFCRARDIRW